MSLNAWIVTQIWGQEALVTKDTRTTKSTEAWLLCSRGFLLLVNFFISVAHLCRWGDETVGWGYRLLNGLSITSGGRWLIPFFTESDPDSHSTILLSPVFRPTGGFVLVSEWQMEEWIKTAHWGWTCEAGRERQTSVNYIQDSGFNGT